MTEIADVILAQIETGQDPSIEIGPDEDLFATGALDSLSIANLVAFLEEFFEVSIPVSDLTVENFGTVNAIANFISTQKAKE